MKIHYNNGKTEKMIDNIIAIQVIGNGEPITAVTSNGKELVISLNNIEMIVDDDLCQQRVDKRKEAVL